MTSVFCELTPLESNNITDIISLPCDHSLGVIGDFLETLPKLVFRLASFIFNSCRVSMLRIKCRVEVFREDDYTTDIRPMSLITGWLLPVFGCTLRAQV